MEQILVSALSGLLLFFVGVLDGMAHGNEMT